MGQKVLIVGASGTGKSTSLRNFARDEVCFIKSISKPLPFRGGFDETYKTDRANVIIEKMQNTDKKVIVIDDAQYIMGNEFFRRAQESGWNKFTDIGQNFFNLLEAVDDLADDVIVYILCHIDKDQDGNIKVKTIGKMLDEKLTIEGTATIVLMTGVLDGVYTFQTQNSGHDICKSPMGMFSNFLIDNDLKMVDGIIREYYELSDVKVEEKGVAAEKPTRASRRVAAVNKEEEKPVVSVEKPKRERKAKTTDDQTNDQTPIIDDQITVEATEIVEAPVSEEEPPKRQRKTLAEKMAEGGFDVKPVETTTDEPVVRRSRRIKTDDIPF